MSEMHDDVPVDIGKFMCDARFHIHAYIHSRAQVEHHYFEFISLSRCQFLVIVRFPSSPYHIPHAEMGCAV